MSRMITLVGLMEHPENDPMPTSFMDLKFPIEAKEINKFCHVGKEYMFKYFDLPLLGQCHPAWFETNDEDLNIKIKHFLDEEQNKKNQ